jgi:5,10-methylenetetrahydromethanopterin reductase
VPSYRHPLAQASAIGTIEALAPGRLAVGFGTGFTGRAGLGQKPLSLSSMRRYILQVRGLLRGEPITVDGAKTQILAPPGWLPQRPMHVPLLLAAQGPKGRDLAHEVADGLICLGAAVPGFATCLVSVNGTVLDDGEDVTSTRVQGALGPWYVVRYHGVWQAFPDALPGMPGGEEWLANLNAERPEGERHLAVHEGHVTHVMPRDGDVLALAGDALATTGWVGSPDEIHQRAVDLAATGADDLMFTPAGDFEREMRAWAAAVRG